MRVVKLWPLSRPASNYEDQKDASGGYFCFQHVRYRWEACLEEHEKSLTDEEILKVAVPLAELSL